MTVPAEPDLTPAVVETPPAAAPEPPAAPPAELDLESELEERTYTKAEIQTVRQEAARRRIEAKEAKEARDALYAGFDDPSDVDYLIATARKLQDDPKSTAAEFRAIAQRIEKALGESGEEPQAAPVVAEDEPLTVKKLKEIEEERAVAQAHVQLIAEAKALNERYVDGNPEYAQLLWYATHDPETAGSLQKAHDKMVLRDEGIRQAAVDAYITRVREGAEAFPPVTAPGGGSPAAAGAATPPKDWKEASASALAKLQARQG